MAKRDNGTDRTGVDTVADAMERRVLAFAGELGRIAGAVQAKTEGWMDRERLNKQIASVRDGAADLLEQLAGGAAKAAKRPRASAPARAGAKGRSGGVVDARGKRHRKAMPAGPAAKIAESQAAKMRAAMPMAKTGKRRGRG